MKTVFICILFISQLAHSDVCRDWFVDSKIQPTPACLSQCLVYPIGMGTFTCHNECEKFCDTKMGQDFIFNASYLYPGLTDEERSLIASDTKDAAVVYFQKNKAENLCKTLYGINDTNDESDACRHFIWACYLTQTLGKDKAMMFLNAHEQQPAQSDSEKKMDLDNNKIGVQFSSKFKEISEDQIVNELKRLLKTGELTVLKPKNKKEVDK